MFCTHRSRNWQWQLRQVCRRTGPLGTCSSFVYNSRLDAGQVGLIHAIYTVTPLLITFRPTYQVLNTNYQNLLIISTFAIIFLWGTIRTRHTEGNASARIRVVRKRSFHRFIQDGLVLWYVKMVHLQYPRV